jgi:hypothetical protein
VSRLPGGIEAVDMAINGTGERKEAGDGISARGSVPVIGRSAGDGIGTIWLYSV